MCICNSNKLLNYSRAKSAKSVKSVKSVKYIYMTEYVEIT